MVALFCSFGSLYLMLGAAFSLMAVMNMNRAGLRCSGMRLAAQCVAIMLLWLVYLVGME